MFLALFAAFLGYLFGGRYGLVVGAALGYLASRLLRWTVMRALVGIQNQFLDSTFAVMGALCKADGVVSRDEIRAVQAMFQRLRLSETQVETAKQAFNKGKSPSFELDAEVERFARLSRGNRALYQLFLQAQLVAVVADGKVEAAEREMLVRVARGLGLSGRDLDQLEALLRAATAGAAGPSSGPPPQQRLDDAYAALGVSPNADDAAVKRAYRKLIVENHPDKLAGKGLPQSMRELAEQRARDINTAYGLIKRARGLS